MKTTIGIDLRRAADQLRATGIRTGDRRLRDHLISIEAIRKTQFGYEVTPRYRDAGLLITQNRQHIIITESGRQIMRHYTVVLVTEDGLSWLRGILTEAAAARQVAG
ncbi:MAG: hypothetical protein Q8K97_07550 [Pseudohongiella sp.]|nr:hypothetical protein [Pseudohongiella sp.]